MPVRLYIRRKSSSRSSLNAAEHLLETRPFALHIQPQRTLQSRPPQQGSSFRHNLSQLSISGNNHSTSQQLLTERETGNDSETGDRAPKSSIKDIVQRVGVLDEESLQTKQSIQRQAESMDASSDVEQTIEQQRGKGQALDKPIRLQMEQSFEADYSNVKVHTSPIADQLSRTIQAKAFTTGQDIFFRQGEYQPNSKAGQELLAHELTHVVQQNTSIQRKSIDPTDRSSPSTIPTTISQTSTSEAPIQRLMSVKDFQDDTEGSLLHPRKRIKKIDGPLKKIEQSGMDSILLNELLQAIDGWLKVASEDSTRKSTVEQLRQETLTEIEKISQSLVSDFDPENPPARGRSNAFSAEVTGAGKQYGSDFSDFDSKQFRVTGKAPTRHIEEVKRATLENGSGMYYATGLVTNFKGSAPMVAPYPEPIPLGDWYPKVTHINGMAVAPKSGILSAAALQESVNSALGGKDEVALGQDAVDLLYTYSAQRGNAVFDLIDCIKGKLEIEDEATGKQEEIMLDAVHRKQRVTVSAHSRGTIKTDNAVRSTHDKLTKELMPEIRSLKLEEAIAYWEINDPGLGLDPETLAELSISGFAAQEAKRQMNEFIQLIYAGNAVQHPSAFIDIKMYVGGLDLVSMFVGTYSDLGRKIDAAIGTGGSKTSKLDSVGGTKGHGFVGNYVPSVGKEIADDLKKR